MALRNRTAGDRTRLQCGRTVDELWAIVRAGDMDADEHLHSCPDCRSRVDGLVALSVATDALVAETPRVPAPLLETVLRVLRRDSRRGEAMELFGGGDAARVSVRMITRLVRLVVDSHDELGAVTVHAGLGKDIDQVDVHIAAEVLASDAQPPQQVKQRLHEQLTDMLAARLGLRLGALKLQLQETP